MNHLRIPLTLLALILPAALVAGCELDTQQPSVESGSGEKGGKPKVAKVGDKVGSPVV